MKKDSLPEIITDSEIQRLSRPAALAVVLLCAMLVFYGVQKLLLNDPQAWTGLALGSSGILYAICVYFYVLPAASRYQKWRWAFILVNAIAVGCGLAVLPPDAEIIPHAILILVAALMVIVWDRQAALMFISIALAIHLPFSATFPISSLQFLIHFSLFAVAIVIIETIHRLTLATRNHIQRLEILNRFARQIGYSLETHQVTSLLNAALQNALEADTYYLGIVEGDQVKLDLFYDGGEYFSGMKIPFEGTLSGWVITNRRELFVPDLRNDVDLEGVRLVVIGQERTSLSWMGVPLYTAHLTGILAVGSYRPNAFDRADLELLENLAQQAALALDNASHYAEVERQSRLDSLTQVFNHGYFLEILRQEAEKSSQSAQSLSLIMLDIDYFKQYNDNYGHLVGDQVLTALTQVVRAHIKSTDAVGRWGGEEFAVLLPNTTGLQATQIALRIRTEVNDLKIIAPDGRQLPLPTISQGVAVYPLETEDIIKLVDLADQRLYIAKERGRNQIEPREEHWKYLL